MDMTKILIISVTKFADARLNLQNRLYMQSLINRNLFIPLAKVIVEG